MTPTIKIIRKLAASAVFIGACGTEGGELAGFDQPDAGQEQADAEPELPTGDGVCDPDELPIGYTLVDLGTFSEEGGLANAHGINNVGEVVGESEGGDVRGFYWNGEADTPIEGIVSTSAFHGNRGKDINDQGEIVGFGGQDVEGTNGVTRGFFRTVEGEVVAGGPEMSYAYAVNNAGLVVGDSLGGGAYVWDAHAGEIVFQGRLEGAPENFKAVFEDINEPGLAVGSSVAEDYSTFPTYWTEDEGLVQLPRGPGRYGVAYGVNDQGQIVATIERPSFLFDCVLYEPGDYQAEPTVLGVLAEPFELDICRVDAINNLGHVVGSDSSASFSVRSHAWVWIDGTKLGLNALLTPEQQQEWHLSYALDINDEGVIVGISNHNNIPGRAFVATPVCN